MPRRRLTSAEIRLLIERYPIEGPTRLAQELDRSKDSISSFARRCGLRTMRRPYQRHATVHAAPSDKIPDAPN